MELVKKRGRRSWRLAVGEERGWLAGLRDTCEYSWLVSAYSFLSEVFDRVGLVGLSDPCSLVLHKESKSVDPLDGIG